MATAFDLIVFDWDGTLMDSEARIVACVRAAALDQALAVPSDAAIRNIIGLGLAEAIETLYPGRGAAFRAAFTDRYRHHFLTADPTPSALFPGAAQTVRRLGEHGYLLAVATGKGRRGLDQVLVETGLGEWFHATRCADETCSKPHPQMLLELMDELDVAAERTLMVGDTVYDLQMAQNAGVTGLAVSYGVHDTGRLLACGPAGCIHAIDELEPWLRQRMGA